MTMQRLAIIILMLLSWNAQAAIAVGAHARATSDTSNSTTTPAVTTQASGSTCVIFANVPNSSTIASVVDSKANTYTLIRTDADPGDGFKIASYYKENCVGGTNHTATVQLAGGADPKAVYFVEITGGLTSGILDQQIGVLDVDTPFDATVTTTTANQLVLSILASSSATATATWNGGFTEIDADTTGLMAGGGTASRVVTSIGTYGPAATTSAWGYGLVVTLSFREAGGELLPNFPFDHSRSIAAGSLYVSPTGGSPVGSDANDCASQTTPCLTIQGAISKLGTSTSKIIYLMAGTHSLSAVVTASGSGTSSVPIQVTSLPGAEPVIDCNGLSPRCFTVDGANWWRFSHLEIVDWGGATSEGAFTVAENHITTGFQLYAIEGSTSRHGDNQGLVHYWNQERAPDTVVDRVRLTFLGDPTSAHQNTAGIYINRPISTGAVTFNHLEFFNFPIGLYHKHGEEGRTTTSNATVSNSLFADNSRVNVGHNPAGWVYTNVIFGAGSSPIILAEEDGGAAGDANQYIHCTFYAGLNLADQGDGANNNKLFNSVISSSLTIELGSITSDSNYNAFGAGSVINGTDLTAWRSANSSDAQSVQGTLSFAGGADDWVPAFYALAVGSAGKGAASDGSDMGADTTRVGVQAP